MLGGRREFLRRLRGRGRGFAAIENVKEGGSDFGRVGPFLEQAVDVDHLRLAVARLDGLPHPLEQSVGALLADFSRGGELAPADGRVGELFQIADLVHVAPRDQGNGRPLLAGTAGAPDAVHVILRVVRQIEIHDQFEVVHVDPSAGHVGRHEEIESACFEFVHHPGALRLGDAAVETVGGNALRLQIVGQIIDRALRVAENNPGPVAVEIDDPQEGVELRPRRNFVIPLRDIRSIDRLLVDLEGDRIPRVAVDQFADGRGNGGREKGGLLFRRHGIEDFFDVIAEAHVEHAIRFVQHDETQAVELQRTAFQVVNDTARCAEHDLGPAFEFLGLTFERRSTVNRHGMDPALAGGQFVHFPGHLGGQLAGGAEDQHLHGVQGGIGFFDRGNGEGGGFARSGLRLPDDIFACH